MGILRQNGDSPHVIRHNQYCANRNVKAALLWLLCTAFITLLVWKPIAASGNVIPTSEFDRFLFIVVRCCAILTLASMILEFSCISERTVLSVWIASMGMGVLRDIFPTLGASLLGEIKMVKMALWAIATVICLSMLSTAIQARRA